VSLGCSATKYRRGVRLDWQGNGRWTGTIRLVREDVANVVLLTPLLVRSRNIRPTEATVGFATFAGAILGEGAATELALDRSAHRFEGDFKYLWEHFDKSQNPWVAGRPNDVFYCSPQTTPLVHLNLNWLSLQPILDSKSIMGVNAALRFAYGAVIGQDVWTQLLIIAVFSIRQVDEEWVVNGEPWRGEYAKRVAEWLYPDDTEQERLKQLYEQSQDIGSVGSLVTQIGSLAHELSGAGKLLDRAAKAASPNREPASNPED
jgi:hypothetical protein